MLIVGGDRRMYMAGALLKREGHHVEHLRGNICPEWQEIFSWADAILLPYPYSQKDGCIPGLEHGGVEVNTLLQSAKAGAVVFAGRGMDGLGTASAPLPLLKHYEDDRCFVQRNAEISAEAAVCELMQRSDRTLDEQNILVLGYGTFARAIVQRLKAMGARVWAAARREKVRLAAANDGAQAVRFDQLTMLLPQMHAVLNTVPSIVLGRDLLAHCTETALLLELASPPYGFDLPAAVELERNVTVLPGLPARYAPQSAAAAVAQTVIRQLAEVEA